MSATTPPAAGSTSPALARTALGRIGQIALTVHDIPRAVAFYRDALGMTQLPIPAPSLAFFDCAGVRLMLSLPDAATGEPGGSVLYFVVPDIDRGYDDLRARGVEFIDQPHLIAKMPDHELWMTFFRDPDGNALALMCEKRS